jgi:hypothetical protein
MQLSKIQEGFKTLMLDHPRALETPPAEFADLFTEGDIPLPERLKVYRNNIVGNLTEVFLNHFPLVRKIVGDDFLKLMARTYILAHPPQGGYLNAYGDDFDDFIKGFAPAKTLTYLPDVARLDIAMNAAYNAQDDAVLQPQDLAAIAPDDLAATNLPLRASARLVASPYALEKIRAFCVEEQNPEAVLDVNQGASRLLVYRPALDVLIVSLSEEDFSFLNALACGQTLGDALEHTLTQYPAFDFQAFLQRHIMLESFGRPS